MAKLLSRDQFRETVLARRGGLCCLCAQPAVDAHHLLERRLWPDGGYYAENGAAVCAEHHLACERTDISVEELRTACGIQQTVLPPHLYEEFQYDKWGNILLPNGRRVAGELFHDASVQKVLAGHLDCFIPYTKYPRTHHAPWSLGKTDDDRVIPDLKGFVGQEVVVTTKMDGENTSIYRDYLHARSLDSGPHPSRTWVKTWAARWQYELPEGWRVCGENLYAAHSIPYQNLETYFLGFSVWNDRNQCLSWDETLEWFALLGITPVPTLYRGPYDEKAIQQCWNESLWGEREGYVVRTTAGFGLSGFARQVMKFVRPGHVQTAKHHWATQAVIPNGLRGSDPLIQEP